MPKYTPDRLKEMAQIVTEAHNDLQFQLIMTVSMITGLSASEVVHHVQELADA